MTTVSLRQLEQFTGTEHYWKHPSLPLHYTDGVKYVAGQGGASWLIDAIGSAQSLMCVKREPFQVWTLNVKDHSGVLTAEDGNGREVYRHRLEYTDFPLPRIKLFFTDSVLLLPSEY